MEVYVHRHGCQHLACWLMYIPLTAPRCMHVTTAHQCDTLYVAQGGRCIEGGVGHTRMESQPSERRHNQQQQHSQWGWW